MITYQDFLKVGEDEKKRINFVLTAISTFKHSDEYKMALIAEDYDRQQNTTIMQYQKMLRDLNGKETPDVWSANYKLPSNFFSRFVTQENQYLLGNGVTWENNSGEKLGEDFDSKLQKLGRYALVDGCGFGFWNYDHLDVFRLTEFVPLWDEEDGSLKAGIRFWQIDNNKPLRATLYEIEGYTNVMQATDGEPLNPAWQQLEGNVYTIPRQKYVLTSRESAADGIEIIEGENYPSLPIVPLWGNLNRQSELVGIRNQIDAYDLIKSGFANDIDTTQLYWILHNTGGMDDVDLAKFIRRIKSVGATMVDSDDGVAVETHTLEIPTNAREALLDRLSKDLHRDFMALDTDSLASSNATATQIRAAYEPLNAKVDQYEYCVLDFLQGIMELAGIEDNPTFTRSKIVNAAEEIQTVVTAAQMLSREYVTTKILSILGDSDKIDDVLAQMEDENMATMGMGGEEDEEESLEDMPQELDDDDDTEIEDMLDDFDAELEEMLRELDEDEE